jgi:uncharacterized protein
MARSGSRSEAETPHAVFWRQTGTHHVIIAAGFAIFVLSDFPPTQRFGLVVLAGTIIDILANLVVLPFLGGAQWKAE